MKALKNFCFSRQDENHDLDVTPHLALMRHGGLFGKLEGKVFLFLNLRHSMWFWWSLTVMDLFIPPYLRHEGVLEWAPGGDFQNSILVEEGDRDMQLTWLLRVNTLWFTKVSQWHTSDQSIVRSLEIGFPPSRRLKCSLGGPSRINLKSTLMTSTYQP